MNATMPAVRFRGEVKHEQRLKDRCRALGTRLATWMQAPIDFPFNYCRPHYSGSGLPLVSGANGSTTKPSKKMAHIDTPA